MNNIYWKLFRTFFKIGLFTFGGGWAMVSMIEKESIDKNKWVTKEEFVDMLAVAQSLPGIFAVNFSVSIGDKLKGFKGSLAAALGTIMPSFIIILAIAMFLTPETIMTNDTLNSIFKGIRPAVVALIIAPVLTMAKTAQINIKTIAIPIVVALLIYSGLPVVSNPIIYIVLGAVGGYIYYTWKTNKNARTNKKG